MANDIVGVELTRVAEAASALENLRSVLAANVPVIVRTMEEYWSTGAGTPVSLAPLKQAEARSVDDAVSMRDRSTLALAWEAQHPQLRDIAPTVPIAWGTSQAELAQAAGAAAAVLLADAEARVKAGTPLSGPSTMKYVSDISMSGGKMVINPFSQKTYTATITTPMDEIVAVEQEIRDHSSDKEWLRGFWSQPGAAASAANLAATLNVPNQATYGAPALTAANQKTLATIATSLAAACRLNALPAGQGQQLVASFTKAAAGNPWSAAMLLKAGPSGSFYGTGANSTGANLLTGVTRQVLTAYTKGQYAKGALTIPINPELYGGVSNSQLSAYMNANNPLTAMLTLDTQNKTAAQEVMAGYDPVTGKISTATGQAWATWMLTKTGSNSSPVTMDGYGIPAGTVGKFLDASTSGQHVGRLLTNGGEYSAYAAYNLINATPAPGGDPGGFSVPEPIRQALLKTALRYMIDLAASTQDPKGGVIPPSSAQNFWHFAVGGMPANLNDPNALSNFLQQISASKNDAAVLDGSAKAMFGNLYARSKLGTLPPGFDGNMANNEMAGLLGRIATEANNVGVNLAGNEDVRNVEYNFLIKLAEQLPKLVTLNIAGEAGQVTKISGMNVSSFSLMGFAIADVLGLPDAFRTDNAISAAMADAHNFAVQATQIHVSMVQGLLSNHAADLLSSAEQYNQKQPPQLRWLKGNTIVLTKQNYYLFNDWYTSMPSALDNKYGFSSLESRYGSYYNSQGAISAQTGPGSSAYQQGGGSPDMGAGSPW